MKTDSDSTFKLVANGGFGEIKSTSLKAQIFEDVPRTHKSFAAIKYLKDEAIVKGYADGTFQPDGTLNRAETVKMLVESFKIPNKEDAVAFTDINGGEWFNESVKKAAANGLIKGYPDGSFQPGKTITKAEFLTIALRAAKLDVPKSTESPYTDVPTDTWFSDVFAYAKNKDLFEKSDTIKPHYPITREEAAVVIFELIKLASVR
ncbi:S-layer homology domain-containing protein [Candidatus Gracilibacteria bacterium]|nr:S-layer homology domain-containing protein [Candidatus Gracilibacteria bacterium]